MYWTNPNYHRPALQPIWAENLRNTLQLIKESVQGERHDELLYEELIALAPSPEQAEVIAAIRDDERGHRRMFRDMFRDLTGQDIQPVNAAQYEHVTSYVAGLQQALQGELAAVETYRRIWFGAPVGIYRDTVFGIILDELKHASQYNYLFTLNLLSSHE
ncbi:ferritin-like domain-containing protein [Paenibacillus xerothermodurans]|uniref:Ferritin-like domain-containing protein n=1 Tax=Paenibacillus xerothermodurans TaxID=1977292 RepID=A0A2W1P0S2_PAEXE|nr:ferritin-like domain-containing protein [Paenibacillus xerothermodurans]PZE21342.1 ferritin-like domain-containing protein [Paenibacillus xerothermodurans]